ncbi:hypothetical protein JQ600_13840 [Bradyrhizobium sp. AUGA SZCCT0176]|uniref:hypothetical protein n=1 Tax=Bradyrhizobium sp. AUGA SZCCT0176 TaxID=2807664 RepID=UPI001BA4FACB|nr:hypothetical protein [Bradyrhizobium sp. AUGA SZCCT0176]MBR1226002.1 hypothetical protein [Bradyrhizobium sp. AUGA SZCCT0176]
MLLLRRGQVASILTMTGVVYATGLVFPISTQKAVDAIVAGRADWALAGLALTAIAAVGLEASIASWRQKLVIRLVVFIDRRVSRKVFAHLMRARIDGADFAPATCSIIFSRRRRSAISSFINCRTSSSMPAAPSSRWA